MNRKKIGALAGVVPYIIRSGKSCGEAHISGGRSEVRSCLYMATLSAIKHDVRFKAFYEKLQAKGKRKKVAMVACMHKLLRTLNQMMATRKEYKPPVK